MCCGTLIYNIRISFVVDDINNAMIKVVITHLPIASFSYYEWLLLGLYEMERKNIIKLKFKIGFISRFALLWCDNKYISGGLRRVINDYTKNPSYILQGYVQYEQDGKIKIRRFAYDSADAPFIYDDELLSIVDVYFKMQCPKEISTAGFPLNKDILIPYCNAKIESRRKWNSHTGKRAECVKLFDNLHKVKPAMVGPRRLAWSCKYKSLKAAYDAMLQQVEDKSNLLMAYFGNAQGPTPSAHCIAPDFNWESDIVAFYAGKLNHPNEKRAKAACFVNEMGKGYDARVINLGNSDATQNNVRRNLIVPYNQFSNFVARFRFNLNISGYRMSIPNRFIESFMVGTAVLTDKLYLKWYKPFGCEVFETVDMGYQLDENVDWETFKSDLGKLPQINSRDVLSAFFEKWSPEVFAKYVIDTIMKANI